MASLVEVFMTEKRSYRQYPREFKEEAVASITDQGYSVQKAADSPGIGSNLLYRWQRQQEDQKSGKSLAYWHHLAFDPRWAMLVLAGTTLLSSDSLEV